MNPFAQYAAHFQLAILATGLHLLLYYVFITFHLKIKMQVKNELVKNLPDSTPKELLAHARNTPGVAADPRFIRADRTVLNMLEQMPAFYISLWLFSIFVNAKLGGILGLVYVFIRGFYYLFYYRGALLSYLVTYPNYAIVGFFTGGTVLSAFGVI